jgi:ribosomal protein S18 acetylase RimI-like enzyme
MIEIVECNFENDYHRKAVVKLMNHYMADRMGGCLPPFTSKQADALIDGLQKHPSKIVLLAKVDDVFAGLVNSFINFSTFAGQPFINIHDVVVLDKYRGRGIGRKLLEDIIRRANQKGHCKITLEVRDDNLQAQALYADLGFRESIPVMHFWTKNL